MRKIVNESKNWVFYFYYCVQMFSAYNFFWVNFSHSNYAPNLSFYTQIEFLQKNFIL